MLVQDVRRFLLRHYPILVKWPLQIYSSATEARILENGPQSRGARSPLLPWRANHPECASSREHASPVINNGVGAVLGRLGIYRPRGEHVSKHAALYLLGPNPSMDLHETGLQVELDRLI